MIRPSRAVRLYRTALRLLPRDFREHFGEEMAEMAEARLREARPRGSLAYTRQVVRLLTDLTTTYSARMARVARFVLCKRFRARF